MSKKITGVYYTNWSSYGDETINNKYPSSLALQYITHVFYAFLRIDALTGEIDSVDTWADYEMPREFTIQGHSYKCKGLIKEFAICKKHYDFQFVVSVGGWGHGAEFAELCKDDDKIRAFARSAVSWMGEHGVDGIDIDWEYPEDAEQAKGLVKILSALKKVIDEKADGKLTLSIASPAGFGQLEKLNLPKIDQYIDFWNVMTYDFSGSWSEVVGHLANLYNQRTPNVTGEKVSRWGFFKKSRDKFDDETELSCNSVIFYYISKGIANEKLVLGMPTYSVLFNDTRGYGTSFESTELPNPDKESYGISEIPPTEMEVENHYLPKIGASYCYCAKRKCFISYDDMNVLKDKLNYCIKHKLGGGFFWEAGADYSHQSDRSHVVYFGKHIR